jgi:3',5'-nucleoside bisphosphate phosphatase
MRADLHLHSDFSDGRHSPREVFSFAAQGGLDLISITDHDTVNHIPDCLRQAEKAWFPFIPGVEFSTDFQGRDIHVLGYAPDIDNPALREHLARARGRRFERARRILRLLDCKNVIIPDEELDRVPEDQTIGRPLIARLLIKYNYVHSFKEAFDRYLGQDAPAYVEYELVETRKVLELIRQAGGISVLAHPVPESFEKMVESLAADGLMGVEVYRPQISPSQLQRIQTRTLEMGLIATGGSDWHENLPQFRLGDFHLEAEPIRPFLDLVSPRVELELE